VSNISTFARPSKGVRIMKFAEGSDTKVLSVATAEHDDDEVNAVPEAPDADAQEVETPEEAAEESVLENEEVSEE